jgi:AcrR family transcriptional regulator
MAPRSRDDSQATRAASRARILAAARTLFAERGFFACRVADVARRAGMSPGNVYWHFDSK